MIALIIDKNETAFMKIVFDSHGKFFHLRLRRDVTTISANVQVEMPSHLGTLDTSHIYEGTLADEHNSRVWGNVRGGVFDGVIESGRDGVFYVEHAHKYFPRHNSTEAGFHSVIYHDDNVHDPYSHLRRGHATGCGMTDEIEGWMQDVQYGSSPDDGEESVISNCGETTEGGEEEHYLPPEYKKLADNLALHSVSDNYLLKEKYKKIAKQLKKDYHDKYSASSNINSIHSSSSGSSRVKRSLLGVGANNRGTCTLSIQTDPMLWHYIHDKKSDDVDRTKDDITAMISQHVKAINNIYGDVIFEGRYKHQGIRFEVQRIKIDDDSLCGNRQGGEMYKFCRTNVDVSNFLNLHSKTNHDDFCLAYVFTFRDFTGGTLGLAWVASPSGASGGICEKYKTYTENLAGFRHTEQRSLNTGIITFLNYNNRVPPKVSQLTLAHEIGHNFGSPHDYPERCKPGGLQGNYIMFSSATSGDRPNNSKFSPCSVRNITKVLDAIIENRRKNCFKATDGAFCGNKIVEQGEECDCGYDDKDCDEICCYPKLISKADKARDPNAKPCTRRNTQCSPSEGPCCNRNSCKFISGMECHAPTDCTLSSSCNGYNASCPKPRARSNLTFCNEDTKVCLNGECSGSICLAHNMQECFLTSDVVQDKKKLCEIACQKTGIPNSCKSTSELRDIFNSTVFMRPGAPCNNFQGYCDVFQKCRAVDAEGPLARLKNLLFSQDTLNSLAEWITQYWYGVLLIGVAFVVVMGMFIRCCAVHTPSSNPNKPAARSITETLRRPVNTIRRVKHHQLHNQPGPSRGNRNSREVAPKPSPSEPSSNRASRSYTDDPPPPYPGSRPPPTRHGYGEGRGHYNRPKGGKRHENSAV
ncbi:Disintegrin and metalloproteinase domain-containing protein 10 [Armadillidium nasatum]|uniref:ADAM10 endopeptidase n=1 Tax=Armadillidium nasatum TaxID=96803 RepID=A0A5N5T7Y8_9CRUS|nr:Disintegrin and metalloproteinase domain-containing protein 10 [Armadillidium nasatum]